jgi:ribokinase
MCNVLVVGSVNMDVITPADRLPVAGETLRAGEITLSPGGKGANAAVAAARLGANVRFVGCVGDDVFGSTLRANLESEGVDCTHLRTVPECSSGSAIILLNSQTGQNSILIGAGANSHVTVPNDSDLFAWADALVVQLEIPVDVCIKAIERAHEQNVLVAFDPAPALCDLPDQIFQDVDIISPNETELAILTSQSTETLEQIHTACEALLARGVKHVVAKLGDRGAYHCSREGNCHYPSYPVKVVDSTAAGDTFTAALTARFLETHDFSAAIPYACAAGALACTRTGAQTALPTRTMVDEFLLCFHADG